MSYILDALRKADAQRDRHRLPDLHAHPLGAPSDPRRQEPMAGRWPWVAGSALVVLGAAFVGLRGDPADAPARVASAPVAPAPAQSSSVEVERAPVPASPAATAIQPPAPPPLPEPARNAGAESASARVRVPAPQAVPAAVAPMAAVPSAAPAPAGTTGPGPIAATPPPGAPALKVSGGVYSGSAAQRMLVVNGQVFNEGSELAPGVVLEQVRADRSAVLRFNGQRYAVPY